MNSKHSTKYKMESLKQKTRYFSFPCTTVRQNDRKKYEEDQFHIFINQYQQ